VGELTGAIPSARPDPGWSTSPGSSDVSVALIGAPGRPGVGMLPAWRPRMERSRNAAWLGASTPWRPLRRRTGGARRPIPAGLLLGGLRAFYGVKLAFLVSDALAAAACAGFWRFVR
ncbi:MAG: hypothetical protein MN733_37775, partial [Nitrososphaera sp.]|nr:hypothetical protein [Nitrososphaera sp.]